MSASAHVPANRNFLLAPGTLLVHTARLARRSVGLLRCLGLPILQELLFSRSIRLHDRTLWMDTGRGIGRLPTNGTGSRGHRGIRRVGAGAGFRFAHACPHASSLDFEVRWLSLEDELTSFAEGYHAAVDPHPTASKTYTSRFREART